MTGYGEHPDRDRQSPRTDGPTQPNQDRELAEALSGVLPAPAQPLILNYPSLDSTMSQARRAIHDFSYIESPYDGRSPHMVPGHPDPIVIVADHQTAGRGRLSGRRWTDQPGASVLVTVARRRAGPVTPGPIAIRAGLAAAETVDRYLPPHRSAEIKWPNDVLIGGRKICGILIEAIPDWYLIGVGVNVAQQQFADGLRTPATSLALESPDAIRPSSPDPVRRDILRELLVRLVQTDQLTDWYTRAEKRLCNLGRTVSFLPADGSQRLRGIVRGIGRDGALNLETPPGSGRIRPFYSGEMESE